jgi:trehalose 6-phosphate phosphatase
VAGLRDLAAEAGVFLDFDGSLAEIVPRPELAEPVPGAVEVLARLVRRYRVVAVVTGRRAVELEGRLPVPGLRILGVYGLEGASADLPLARARSAVRVVPEAWVEDKGATLAVHYRQAPDPDRARELLRGALAPLARSAGLEVLEGKMVIELAPRDRPRKGGAVLRLARELGLRGVLYAGDDVADREAFAALDELEREGVLVLRVAVEGPETPPDLLAAADLVVAGPAGLVELLDSLA